jgi:hypothetical protein
MNKSPDNLSPKQSSIKLKSSKMSEAKVKKMIQNSSSQVSEQNPLFYERKIIAKGNTPLSYTQKKYKNKLDKQNFISKSRRITKYNPNNLVTKKELIIDTRSDIFNSYNFNKLKRKQNPSHSEFKNKKTKIIKHSYKIKFDKSIQINTYNDNLYNRNLGNSGNNSQEENIKSKTNSKFIDPLANAKFFVQIPHPQVTNSLYTILAMKKNQFMDAYNDAKEKEKESLPKVKQLQFLMDKTPMANFYSKKKDIRTFISPSNSPLPYISLLNEDYSISEKIRFQKIMYKLTKLKKCIEDNPRKEYDIAKEFLLSIGLYDVENFDIEKLNNFTTFVKSNFLINP